MRTFTFVSVAALLVFAGCPLNPGAPDSPVDARISTSATQQPAPFTVSFSAGDSTSTNGGPLQYAWNFAGLGTSTRESATFTFPDPGLYRVVLTVTDPTGASDVASVDIRAEGAAPTADIQASRTSGPAPLLVNFDGSGSSAPDDTIRTYQWDFGDGATSGQETPVHAFQLPGTYTVELTVRTAGGVEDSATTTITVTPSDTGSLQFDGGQIATLSLGAERNLTDWTFETWFDATDAGGTLVSDPAAQVSLEILPAQDRIRFTLGADTYTANMAALADGWHHVALVNDTVEGALLYFDAARLARVTALSDEWSLSQLDLGTGFAGRIAEVRFWNEAQSATEIADNYEQQLPITGTGGLLGYWRLDEGEGQTLENFGSTGTDGLRGVSAATEDVDPAWSDDGPPLN